MILLLVLLAIAGVVYRVVVTVRQETETAQETLYEVYFEVAETPAATLAEIRGFDPVYLVETQSRLGYVGVYKDASIFWWFVRDAKILLTCIGEDSPTFFGVI